MYYYLKMMLIALLIMMAYIWLGAVDRALEVEDRLGWYAAGMIVLGLLFGFIFTQLGAGI